MYFLTQINTSSLSTNTWLLAYINATADKKRYIQYYFFNHQTNKLEVYRKLKDIDTLIAEAKTALYFDLACIDKEA